MIGGILSIINGQRIKDDQGNAITQREKKELRRIRLNQSNHLRDKGENQEREYQVGNFTDLPMHVKFSVSDKDRLDDQHQNPNACDKGVEMDEVGCTFSKRREEAKIGSIEGQKSKRNQ